jgi:hypothetical protein
LKAERKDSKLLKIFTSITVIFLTQIAGDLHKNCVKSQNFKTEITLEITMPEQNWVYTVDDFEITFPFPSKSSKVPTTGYYPCLFLGI